MENFVTVRFHDEELRFSSAENLVSKETLITDFLLPKDSLISLRYDMKDGTVGCLLSKDGTAFLLPPDWAGIKFYLKSDKAPSRPATPMNQAMSESSSSQKDSSKFKSYSRYLFYTRILLKDNGSIIEDDRMQYPCVPFQTTFLPKRYFVISTRHGSHSCLEEGDEIKVYNPEHKPFVVKVVYYEDDRDFIVFDSDVKLCDNMPFLGPVVGGTYYTLLGFADVKQDKTQSKYLAPCYTAGVIISSQPNSTGHVSGSSRGLSGFSGGPVFDTSNG
ncbi:unnamed protein product [Auanema sp. JU1783]|nr:unnamed protein product [Auanema sp. JU1783]